VAQIAISRSAQGDLDRLEQFAPGALTLILDAVEMLEDHPLVGRPTEAGFHELVVSRGQTGYIVLYDFDSERDLVLLLGVRHQRELWG